MRRMLKAGGADAEPVWSLADPPRRRPRLRWGRAAVVGLLGGTSMFLSLGVTHVLKPYLDDPDRLAADLLPLLGDRVAVAAATPAPDVPEPHAEAAEPACAPAVSRGASTFHRPPGSC